MERLRLLGAAGGAVFAVVIAVAFAIAPGPSSAGDVKVIEYYTDHGDAAIWQAVLAGFGLVCFVWFVATFSGWSPAGPAVLVSATAMIALYSVTLGAWEGLGENFKGVDIMRAVRSFDPCLPCGVHMYTGKGRVKKVTHTPTGLC